MLRKENFPHSVLPIHIDYYGGCVGNCVGCFIPKLERAYSQAYFPLETLESHLDTIYEIYIKNNFSGIENLLFVMNRGNFLSMDFDSLEKVLISIKNFSQKTKIKNVLMEVPTSLIGKMDKQIEQAKKIITAFAPYHITFTVTANPEITSSGYWSNLNHFFSHMTEYRNSGDRMGNILTLIVPSEKPLTSDFWAKLDQYNFPIVLALVPFISSPTQTQLDNLSQFILDITQHAYEKIWAFSVLNTLRVNYFLEKETPIKALENKRKEKKLWIIDKNGKLETGLFTIYGEIDFLRMQEKIHKSISMPELEKKFLRNKVCLMCPFNTLCVQSGGHLYAAWNEVASTINECPSGLRRTFEWFANMHQGQKEIIYPHDYKMLNN